MRLGLNLGYWGAGNDADNLALAREADRLGFSVVWAAEAYGSDAPTVLAWVAAQTERIDVGSAILQIPARSPAMTAMTAATLDSLSGGRFRLGLGLSGPQVSEGWHGVRFDAPLGRTREYVQIVRRALRRERLEFAGEHFTLPLPDGPGKALRLTVHPVREHIPIYLAAVGPRNLELAGEIADGWLAVFFAPEHAAEQLARVAAGRAAAGKTLDGFDVVPTVPVVIGDDLAEAADQIRAYVALYVGGMGSRQQNFYHALAVRMGYAAQAAEIQDRYLARDHAGAAAAVPFDLIDTTSLIGPVDRIADRMAAYAAVGVGTLTVTCHAGSLEARLATLHGVLQAAQKAGVAGVNLFQAAVLGVVQGLTEFLPVSSTAHLRIVPALAGWPDPGAAFTAVVQLGTMLAILVYFWREIVHITVAWFRGLVDKSIRPTLEYRLGWYVIFATIPISVLGLAFAHQIETGARNLWLIAGALVVLALVLLLAERLGTHKREEEDITLRDGLVVGLAQAAALVPGVSRSGATITAGLFVGLRREAAARFSFLLSIPAVVLSGLFELRKVSEPGGPSAGATVLAAVLAFVVGLASIHWLLRYLSQHSTVVFVGYRVLLGAALFGLLSAGTVAAT